MSKRVKLHHFAAIVIPTATKAAHREPYAALPMRQAISDRRKSFSRCSLLKGFSKMTKTTKAAPKTSELATANNAAITVQATQPAPIAADASAKWEAFTARPGVAATGNALSTLKASAIEVWKYEKEHHTVKSFALFSWDVVQRIALPILSLLWLALNHLYQAARKPEAKAAIVARYQAVKDWAAPKFGYEREVDEAAIEL